ncbi:GNAT family N-acetyltransferase [Baekduia soli]|uniref:GNAT family N-acetyltransferase n=1 Tax=Baekduia soli TaxID=496014 RepID=A0A5B8U7L2_9ACTN|nr:GNAT family N-acetyltransferase [Baekduia soli]QEC48937.1 GNAT family N-acetyltransferase [Baekduia soli]
MIRPAARADARALAELEVRAWRWAYTDIVGEQHMITVEDRERRWRTEPLGGADVAEVGGRVAGVVQTGPSPAEPGVGLLHGLYVEPAAQGAGLGAALYDHAMRRLHGGGLREAVLWVFSGNGHARGFYERRGWVADGATGEWKGAPELRYRHNQAR